jgi:hypothetical protein
MFYFVGFSFYRFIKCYIFLPTIFANKVCKVRLLFCHSGREEHVSCDILFLWPEVVVGGSNLTLIYSIQRKEGGGDVICVMTKLIILHAYKELVTRAGPYREEWLGSHVSRNSLIPPG